MPWNSVKNQCEKICSNRKEFLLEVKINKKDLIRKNKKLYELDDELNKKILAKAILHMAQRKEINMHKNKKS